MIRVFLSNLDDDDDHDDDDDDDHEEKSCVSQFAQCYFCDDKSCRKTCTIEVTTRMSCMIGSSISYLTMMRKLFRLIISYTIISLSLSLSKEEMRSSSLVVIISFSAC